MRLDKALVVRNLVRSRAEAQALIAAGQIRVGEASAQKASQDVLPETKIQITGERCRYVSRGGLKLEAALRHFGIDVTDLICLDAGASTGGFTDCLLQHGASSVIAVDVGHGQRAEALRDHPQIEWREGVNVRTLSPSDFLEPFPLVVADLSFISLTLVLPSLQSLLTPSGQMLLLVKPQFEVGAERLGKNGVVRSPRLQTEALEAVVQAAANCGFQEEGRMPSPILGTEGNKEFLLWLKQRTGDVDLSLRQEKI